MDKNQQKSTTSRPLTKPPVPPKPKLLVQNKEGTVNNFDGREKGKIYYLGPPSVLIPIQATTKERIIPIIEEKYNVLPDISDHLKNNRLSSKTPISQGTTLQPINVKFRREGKEEVKENSSPSGSISKSSLLLEKLNGISSQKTSEHILPSASSVPNSAVTINQFIVLNDTSNKNLHLPSSVGTVSPVTNNVNVISVNGVVTNSPFSSGPGNNGLSTYVYGETPCLMPSFQSRESDLEIRHIQDPLAQTALPVDKRATYTEERSEPFHLPSLNVKSSSQSNLPSLSAPTSPVTKPQLQKSEAFDICDKKLYRGISRATDNETLVSKARSELAQGLLDAVDGKPPPKTPFFVETPIFTFTLPDLSLYSNDFRTFLEKDLIESSTLVSLEAAGRLNWWTSINASRRLWPLSTTGDGNCLLHAASLGMWGFHDRLLTLRKSLYEFLTQSPHSMPLWRRWRWQLSMQNRETGLVYNATEWDEEWSNILRLASSTPRNGPPNLSSSTPNLSQSTSLSQGKLNTDGTGEVYESLEEIHVLALAHILRRPIIVVADTTLKDVNGAPFAPIPFGGIYLPLECPPKECQRSPLILAYDAAHFSALVVMETTEGSDQALLPAVIPVTDCHHDLLPIQFVVDPGEDFAWGRDEHDPVFIQKLTITASDKRGLLTEYLNIKQIPIPPSYLEAAANTLRSEEADALSNFFTAHSNLEKKSSDSSFDSDEGAPLSDPGSQNARTKASKQMLTVVKQFGSIGRNMSKKIKKNLNTLSNFSRTGSFKRKNNFGNVHVSIKQSYILAAEIYMNKRYAYQQEMITNYLNNAKARFQEHQVTIETKTRAESADSAICQCISPGCTLYGTSHTAYMCSGCYNKQKEREEKEYVVTSEPAFEVDSSRIGYGTGRSKFYANLDETAVKNASKIPVTNSLTGFRDRTLFLANSTFYNDTLPSYNLTKRSDSRERRSVKSSKPPSRSGEPGRLTKTSTKESLSPVSIDAVGSLPCRNVGCTFYGSPQMNGFCSKCHAKQPGKEKTLTVEQAKSIQP